MAIVTPAQAIDFPKELANPIADDLVLFLGTTRLKFAQLPYLFLQCLQFFFTALLPTLELSRHDSRQFFQQLGAFLFVFSFTVPCQQLARFQVSLVIRRRFLIPRSW